MLAEGVLSLIHPHLLIVLLFVMWVGEERRAFVRTTLYCTCASPLAQEQSHLEMNDSLDRYNRAVTAGGFSLRTTGVVAGVDG